MKFKGSSLRLLKYLYPRNKDFIFGTIGYLKGNIHLKYISFDGHNFDNDLKTLLDENFIEIDGQKVWLTQHGQNEVSRYLQKEKDEINQDLLIDYDFALLRYISKRNEWIESTDFPQILQSLAPLRNNNTEYGKLLDALFNLKPYLDEKNDWFKLNELGEKYLKSLISKQEEIKYKEKLNKRKLIADLKNAERISKTYPYTQFIAWAGFIFAAIGLYLSIAKATNIWPFHK